jgi:hypothetical protein
MKKTYVYIISFLIILISEQIKGQEAPQPQDSVIIPLKIRAGIEIAGPVMYFIDKNILNIEAYVLSDLSEKMSLYLGAGYSDYKYSQYNYSYLSNGAFMKVGMDFNLLRPETAPGKYWAGIGLHYGLSRFTSETPVFKHENYWGTTSSLITRGTNWGHYLEVSTGFKAELFRNFSIGWSISLKKLIYAGTAKDLKPIYFPGYGEGGKTITTGLNYFIVLNFPYKKIKVAVKKETPEEPEETEETVESSNTRNINM